MRHLIDPLDFTQEETNNILDFADRIGQNRSAYAHIADGKSWLPCFMSQVPVPGCPSNLLC